MIILSILVFSGMEKVTTLRIPMETIEKCEKVAQTVKRGQLFTADIQLLSVKCIEKKSKERTLI